MRLLEGENSASYLCTQLHGLHVAVVHGQSYATNPIRSIIESTCDPSRIADYGAWKESPTSDDVIALSRLFRSATPQAVLAIGGGSVLDLAKAARLLSCRSAILVAVPTTAGSGSEATPYASILSRRSGRWEKISETSKENIPAIVALDPLGLRSLPRKQRVFSSIDALSQAFESYWSLKATDESRAISVRSITLLRQYIAPFQNGNNEHLLEMLRAANCAGRAIAIAPTNCCHAVSYPLTSQFGIPHGWAVGFTLSRAVLRHQDVLGDRVSALCDAAGTSSLVEISEWIESLRAQSGLGCRLSDWGVEEPNLRDIVDASYRRDRMDLAPRPILPEELHRMLREIL